jgi:hypothetical protein
LIVLPDVEKSSRKTRHSKSLVKKSYNRARK